MQVEPKTTTFATLYYLYSRDRYRNEIHRGYVVSKDLANDCIKLLKSSLPDEGWITYSAISEVKMPAIYHSDLKEWAKDNLTVNQYLKHFKEL